MLQLGTPLLTLLALASFPFGKRSMTFLSAIHLSGIVDDSFVEAPKYLLLFLLFLPPHEERSDSMSLGALDLKTPPKCVNFYKGKIAFY